MAKDAVNKILEAETEASRIVADATKEASQISKKAVADAGKYLQDARDKAKAKYDEIVSNAKQKADNFAKEAMSAHDDDYVLLNDKIKQKASQTADEIIKLL